MRGQRPDRASAGSSPIGRTRLLCVAGVVAALLRDPARTGHRRSARAWRLGDSAALGTTYALAYGLGFLIFGPLSDRYGRKPILVPGMAVLAVVTAGLAAAPSLPILAVLRTVQGLVAASFSAVALAYIGEALPPRWRSTGIGAMSTAFLSAGILGQVYAQAVADALGHHWVFGLAAPAFALAAIAIAMILIEPPRSGEPTSLAEKYRALRRWQSGASSHSSMGRPSRCCSASLPCTRR